ncbi:MAG: RidA family protein [Spirochaetales bacterium]|nr:RidA family protein [Spirochaetales bacterium]
MSIEERLKELNLVIPDPPEPVANFVPCRTAGKLVFISGQGPVINNLPVHMGKLGKEISLEDGYEAARLCALNLLSQLKNKISDWNQLKKIVSVRGFVASTENFYDQPKVVNGCSDLLCDIFGDRGIHARCALGVNVLPGNIPVEVEMVVELC